MLYEGDSVENIEKDSTVLSNDEIARRVSDANRNFYDFGNMPENELIISGGAKDFFLFADYKSFIKPEDDGKEGQKYNPLRGEIRLIASDQDTRHLTKALLALEGINDRLRGMQQILADDSINMVYIYDHKLPEQGSGGLGVYHTAESKAIFISMGEEADTEKLDRMTHGMKYNLSFEETWDLQQKSPTILFEIRGIEVSKFFKRNDDGSITEGSSLYNWCDFYLRIPYSEKLNVRQSLEDVNKLFSAMQKAGLYPPSEDPSLNVQFKGLHKNRDLETAPLPFQTYQEKIADFSNNQLGQELPETSFMNCFQNDLAQVRFLDYPEAVGITKSLFPLLISKDLICRYVLCEFGRTKDGEWVILLPSGEYLPPDMGDYRNPYNHSRIDETWGAQRDAVYNSLDADFKPERGYFYQTASGKRFVLADRSLKGEKELARVLAEFGVSELPVEMMNDKNKEAFEKTVYHDQIMGAIDIDSQLLQQAGVSKSDVVFYRYWATRFWLKKDANPKAIYGSVDEKFTELQAVIKKQRKKQ